MHLKRWITGLVAVPFLVFVIVKGGVIFSVFIALIAVIAYWEYLQVVFRDRYDAATSLMVISAYLAISLILWAAHFHAADRMLHVIILYFMVVACLSIIQYHKNRLVFETAQKMLLGIIYIPVMLSSFIMIRNGEATMGAVWIFFILAVVFAGDIGALYTGTFFGKHKINPSVSPKKTIEGSLGGIAANLLVGACFKALFLQQLSWGVSLVFFVSLGAAGQVGDLFESGLKRVAGVKDSGSILPGHGGILDRADAAIFAAPVAYFFKVYLF